MKIVEEEINSNQWFEHKEPMDYGTSESPKLLLISHLLSCEPRWHEGWSISSSHVSIIETISQVAVKHKSDVLKVIDLPSKEL